MSASHNYLNQKQRSGSARGDGASSLILDPGEPLSPAVEFAPGS